jgi:Zn-dependent alcohol dehydrogenase
MWAAILDDGSATVRIAEIAVPVPQSGEALVRVAACGLCHTDLHVIKGEVAFPRPAVLGHEISGTVVALGGDADAGGADGAGPRVGDSVVAGFIMPCTRCDACRRGRDDLCAEFFGKNRLRGTLYDGRSRLAMPDGSFLAMYSMGGLAEYAVVPLSALAVLPDGVDLERSCILGCAGLTSYGAVYRAGHVERGEAIAVIGAGGVGSAVIQMARSAGAGAIVAVDIADDKLETALRLGATHTVNALAGDPVAAVRELSGGGVDAAFEALGNPATFRQATAMLADGGRMVAIGIAAGAATADVEITPLVRRGHTITGSFGARTRADLPEVVRIASGGGFDVDALISRRFELAEAPEAYAALARGEIVGRAIIAMG